MRTIFASIIAHLIECCTMNGNQTWRIVVVVWSWSGAGPMVVRKSETTHPKMHSVGRLHGVVEIAFEICQTPQRQGVAELLKEIEGCKWDAILFCETWVTCKAEIWESHCGHILSGAGGLENKHGVGILVNRNWTKKIHWIGYINERMLTTLVQIRRKKVVLSSVYFLPAEHVNNHVEKMHTCMEHYTKCRKHTTIIAAELGPGCGAERLSVAPYALNESNKRGDRLKDWLMIQNFSRST